MRQLEVKLQCFLQVGKSLLFGFTLAGDIGFEALGDVPIPFPPDGCSERSLHDHILSQYRGVGTLISLVRVLAGIRLVSPAVLAR